MPLGSPSNMEDLILLHLLPFRHRIYTSGSLWIFNFTKYSCHLKPGLLFTVQTDFRASLYLSAYISQAKSNFPYVSD